MKQVRVCPRRKSLLFVILVGSVSMSFSAFVAFPTNTATGWRRAVMATDKRKAAVQKKSSKKKPKAQEVQNEADNMPSNKNNKTTTSNSLIVARRIAKAAKATAAKSTPTTKPTSNPDDDDPTEEKESSKSGDGEGIKCSSSIRMASLTELTSAIDQQLTEQPRPVGDSVSNMIQYNLHQAELNQFRDGRLCERKDVAVVFAPNVTAIDGGTRGGQMSIDYACRIQRLVRAMQQDNYKPECVCFVGPSSSSSSIPVPISNVGYIYFQQFCERFGASAPQTVSYWLCHDAETDHGNLAHVARFVQQECVPDWSTRSRRLRVHFALFSADYHLAQMHDLHIRSPGQSAVQALQNWAIRRPVVYTAWSWRYATTMLGTTMEPIHQFLIKCHRTAASLRPVVSNLHGVVHRHEFFQHENYRVLVEARRSLVTDMEGIYHVQPTLKQVHSWTTKPLDVILESALLSMGRSLDLIRPAGLYTGSVSTVDYLMAYKVLAQAVEEISTACNPDRLLDSSEWDELFDHHLLLDTPAESPDFGEVPELLTKSTTNDNCLSIGPTRAVLDESNLVMENEMEEMMSESDLMFFGDEDEELDFRDDFSNDQNAFVDFREDFGSSLDDF